MSIVVGMAIGVVVLILAQFIDGRVACAIGVAAVAGYLGTLFIWRRRRARTTAAQFGLRPDELTSFLGDLQRGDKDSALGRIASAQERHRSEFKEATGIDSHTITPMIGRDISYADIVGHAFRVCDFERGGTRIGPNGEVLAASRFVPYGYLLVESPITTMRARLPIAHRDDFLLAASVFDEPKLLYSVTEAEEAELLVTYAPKHRLPGGLSGGLTHVLHYVITPRGTLDRYYAVNDDMHMATPAPEKLFGPFVYKGEIRVHVNPEPIL